MESQAPVAHTHTLVITYNKTEKNTTQIHVYTLIQAHDIECIMFYILMMFIQSDYQKHIQHYAKYRIVFAVCFSNQARLHLTCAHKYLIPPMQLQLTSIGSVFKFPSQLRSSSPTPGKPAAAIRWPMERASGKSPRRRAAHLARM